MATSGPIAALLAVVSCRAVGFGSPRGIGEDRSDRLAERVEEARNLDLVLGAKAGADKLLAFSQGGFDQKKAV